MFSSSRQKRCSLFLGAVFTLAASPVFAQGDKTTGVDAANQNVTGAVSSDRIRIAAPNAVVQLRLEVYDESGRKLVDTEQRGGTVLDWHLQAGNGERVADGNYLCVVTIKSLSGRMSQKLGMITVSAQSTTLRPGSAADLNTQQAQSIGPVESGDAGLTVMSAASAQPVTLLANSGDEGQLARTRGALTFRVGDFFSGNDQEQMRLTAEGNLGIGTPQPQAKLDVAGDIRSSGFLHPGTGIEFADGTVQTSGLSGRKNQDGTVIPNVAGTGTQNRITKWTDNAGTLGDSGIFEAANGNIGIGTTAPAHPFSVRRNGGTLGVHTLGELFVDRDDRSRSASLTVGTAGTLKWIFGMPSGGDGFQVFDLTNFASRFFVDPTNGRVGIGTTAPQSALDVAGDLKVSGNAVVAGNIAAKYQDIAEWVHSRKPITAGTVVSLDSSLANAVTPSTHAYDTRVAGVVSATPGVVLGERGEEKALVSTTGRVKVMVDATRHPIRIGDLLVTSELPGMAMRSKPIRVNGILIHRPGTIIGKALEPLSKGQGRILVLLSMQ